MSLLGIGTVGCGVGLLLLAAWLGVTALLGIGAAWVLSYFGLVVPWYVCAVALFILSSIFRFGVTVTK